MTRHRTPLRDLHEDPPSSFDSDNSDIKPYIPQHFAIDNSRRLGRTEGYHQDIRVKRPRAKREPYSPDRYYRDERYEREDRRERDHRRSGDRGHHRDRRDRREQASHVADSETETDEEPRRIKKIKTPRRHHDDHRDGDRYSRTHDRGHSRRRGSREDEYDHADKSHREVASRREDTKDAIFKNGDILVKLAGLSPDHVELAKTLSEDQLRLFLRIQPSDDVPGAAQEAAKVSVSGPSVSSEEVVEGLLLAPEDESQGSDTSELTRSGESLCYRMEDALRDLANETSLDLEPDFAAIRSQFDPIAAAFAGDKIGQQITLWIATDNAARDKLQAAFADAGAKFEAIQKKFGVALGQVRSSNDRKKDLVEEARHDVETILKRQNKDLKKLRKELDAKKAQWNQAFVDNISSIEKLNEAVNKKVMLMD